MSAARGRLGGRIALVAGASLVIDGGWIAQSTGADRTRVTGSVRRQAA